MIRSVVKSDLNVNNRISCKNARLHCALYTGLNSRDVLLRNRTADDRVDELEALLRVGFDLDLNVTVLSLTA